MGRQDVLSQDEETPAITCCQADQCWGEVGGQGEEDANERAKCVDGLRRLRNLGNQQKQQTQGRTPCLPVLSLAMCSSSLGTRTIASRTLG